MQRRRRCTFILSPVLSRRDKTLETCHSPTVDPVMNVQLRPGWQEGSDGRPAAGALLQGRGVVTACPGRWYPYLARRRRGGGAAVSGHPGERVLARVGAGGGSTGPYGVETPARTTARHGPTWWEVSGPGWSARLSAATGLPGGVRLHLRAEVKGAARQPRLAESGGPRSSRPGSAAAWAGAGTEVTEGGAVPPSSAAASPSPVLAAATCCRVGRCGAR